MKRTKRIISVLLTLVMILSALPLTGLTAFAATSGDFEYEVILVEGMEDEDTCVITSYNGSATSLTIPGRLDGYMVVGIRAYAFKDCSFLTSVTIPDNVNIGSYAFMNCTALTSITFSDTVTFIERGAFTNCGFKSFVLPDYVKGIGDYAFQNCKELTDIVIPDTVSRIGMNAFVGTAYYADKANWSNRVLYIGNHLIAAEILLSGDYSVRAGTKTIADNAFNSCAYITKIVIPDSVTYIGECAFQTCYGLKSVVIGNGVKSIEPYTFLGCDSLQDVKIGNNVENIEDYAFEACASLSNMEIPNSVTRIGYRTFFQCISLTDIVIPDSVSTIRDRAFESCTSLANVIFPNDVKYMDVGSMAFSDTAVTEVKLPANTCFEELSSNITSIYVPFGSLAWRCAVEVNPDAVCYSDSVLHTSELKLPSETDFDLYAYPNGGEDLAPSRLEKTAVLKFIANRENLHFEIDGVENGASIYLYNAREKAAQSIPFSWLSILGGIETDENGIENLTVRNIAVGELSDLTVGSTYYLAVICEDTAGAKGGIKLGSYLDFIDQTYTLTENEPLELYTQEKDTDYALAFTPSADGIYYLDGGAQGVLDSDGRQVDAQMFGYALAAGQTYYFIVSHSVGQMGVYTPRRLQTENGFTYMISNGAAIVVSYEGTAQTVTVPEQLGGYPVVWLYSDSFQNNPYMQSIVIPKSVCQIGYSFDVGENIFAGCPNLETIYGYPASAAGTFAKQYGYTFMSLVVADADSDIVVEFSPENLPDRQTALQVTKISATDTKQVFDIILTANHAEIQPTGVVTVKFPVPDTLDGINCKVYRQEADGSYTDMHAVYQDGCMVFTTDHFSVYVLTTGDPNATDMIPGDVNGDGKVTAIDARWALQAASGSRELTAEQFAAADVNGDGKVTAVDARWILQAASGTRVL